MDFVGYKMYYTEFGPKKSMLLVLVGSLPIIQGIQFACTAEEATERGESNIPENIPACLFEERDAWENCIDKYLSAPITCNYCVLSLHVHMGLCQPTVILPMVVTKPRVNRVLKLNMRKLV
jgi:hypothetical protein